MGQFGEKLRREREMRAITLEEIATATKIGTRSLRALEEERFDQLPGGIFNKGFVRAYAKYVGIDEEQALSDYLDAVKAATESSEDVNITLVAEQVNASRESAGSGRGTSALFWTIVIILAGLGAAGLGGRDYIQKWREQRAEARERAREAAMPAAVQAASPNPQPMPSNTPDPQASANSQPNPADPTSAGGQNNSSTPVATASTPAEEPKAAESNSISLVVRAKHRAWIRVRGDGKLITQEFMDPDSEDRREQEFHAHERLVLLVGNAGGIDVTFNGKPLGQVGPEGATRSLTFTPDGVQQ